MAKTRTPKTDAAPAPELKVVPAPETAPETPAAGFGGRKTACPVTRPEFLANAKQVRVQIGDQALTANPKEFSTGSLGWYVNGKVEIPVGDKYVTVQVGLNLTVVNSKELPKS